MTEELDHEYKNPDPRETSRISSLSAREREIAMLYARGQTSREIADELCISPTTVRNHVATIYRKLGIGSKMELVKLTSKASDEVLAQGTHSTGGGIAAQEPVTYSADRALASALAQQRATND